VRSVAAGDLPVAVLVRSGRSEGSGPLLVSLGSVGGVEGLDHGLGDAAAVGDLVAVLPGPGSDRRGLLAVERLRPRPRDRGHLLGSAAARRRASGLAGRGDVRRQRVAQRGGVVVGQVDLVAAAVEAERDRARRSGAVEVVEVVDELHVHLLCHAYFRFRRAEVCRLRVCHR